MKTIIVIYKILDKTYQTAITIDLANGLSINIAKSSIVNNILYKDCEMVKKEYNAVSANIVEDVLFNSIEIVGFKDL